MSILSEFVQLIRDPGAVIAWGGYPGLAAIVFLETGALVFFLPGDSLLVTAGLYAAQGSLDVWLLLGLLVPLALLGDAVSYQIGYRAGPRLFARPRSRLFRPEYADRAREFYERHGGKAIVMARFVPILRTFVPVVAGVARMRYRDFATYNVIGGTAWVVTMVGAGHLLGTRFPVLVQHIEKVIVAVVVLSLLPPLVTWLRSRRAAPAKKSSS